MQRREKAERAELIDIAKILSKAQKSLGKAETEPKLPTGTRNELAGAVWCTASRSALMVGGGGEEEEQRPHFILLGRCRKSQGVFAIT